MGKKDRARTASANERPFLAKMRMSRCNDEFRARCPTDTVHAFMPINAASSRAEPAALHNGPEFIGALFELTGFMKLQISRFKIRTSAGGGCCLTAIEQ